MATELAPVSGLDYATKNVMSGRQVFWFLVFGQTVGAGTITSSSTMGTLAEETGTGYARQAVNLSAATNGIMAVPLVNFAVGSATDWHTTISAAGIASAVTAGTALFVWDLAGGPFDMHLANSEIDIPTVNYFFENVGGI
jgi:hypothetical protein